jgi:hypothetical protein
MRVLPLAVLAADPRPEDFAGQQVRMVLTGPGGGSYDIPMGTDPTLMDPTVADPSDRITMTMVADAVQLCRMAARRLDAAAAEVDIDGDQVLGRRLLAAVGAFARD